MRLSYHLERPFVIISPDKKGRLQLDCGREDR